MLFLPIRLDPGWKLYRFIFSVIITEAIFFTMHKIFHTRKLYKYHKVHHEFIEPCALSSMYCHPLEAIFCNQLATVAGPMLTCMSFEENIIWSILIAINTLKAHSGLRISGFNSRYHDIHHSKQHKNYGFLYLPDIFYGSCVLPNYKTKTRQEE
jgi:methylsterol monooxygenase/4-alpha-methyl-delta7-sterol-4alpha-methyl oxidase